MPHLLVTTADNVVFPRTHSSCRQPLRVACLQPRRSLLCESLIWVSPTPHVIVLASAFFGLLRTRSCSWGIPSSDTSFSIRPSMVSDPGRLLCAHPIVHNIIGFQLQDSLALCVCRISRLNPFTRVIGERYLSPGSSRFVASPPAGFCSDVVVSLLSGWILPTRLCQLAWRTL